MTKHKHPTNRFERMLIAEKKKKKRTVKRPTQETEDVFPPAEGPDY
jgi:hypothetical protein